MSFKRRTRLSFEQLEDRCVPAATIFSSAGNLTILGDNAGNNIMVDQLFGGGNASMYAVTVNAVPRGTFTVTRALTITSGSGADSVSVNFVQDTALTSLAVNTNGGNDTVSVGPSAEFFATLTLNGGTGALSITTGAGTDLINFGTASTAAFTVNGNVQLNGGANSDTANVGADGMGLVETINGNLALVQANNAMVVNTAVSGNLSATNAADLMLANVIDVDETCTVGIDLGYTGGTGTDSVTLDALVGDDVNVATSSGMDTVTLTNLSFPTIVGDLIIQTGDGNDSVTTDTTVFGNSTIDLGSGNNSYTATDAVGPGFGGNLLITAGAGNDSVTVATTVGGFAGDLNVNLGNGDNMFTFGPVAFVGGALNVTTGSGADTILIPGGLIVANATLNTGAGNDIVTIGAVLIGGNLSFDLGAGDDMMTLTGTLFAAGVLMGTLGTGADSLAVGGGTSGLGGATINMGSPSPGVPDGAADMVAGLDATLGFAATYLNCDPFPLDSVDGGPCP